MHHKPIISLPPACASSFSPPRPLYATPEP
jgi:hypothetical protein